MAQVRIYHFPPGELAWIGQAAIRLTGHPQGLSLILESPARTICAELKTEDLKRLLVDLATAIYSHKLALDIYLEPPPSNCKTSNPVNTLPPPPKSIIVIGSQSHTPTLPTRKETTHA